MDHVVHVVLVESKKRPRENGDGRQNLTVQLPRDVVRKARILAAGQGTSISRLVAQTIERLAEEEDAYEEARRRALAWIAKGFHLGGRLRATRDELHER